MDKQQFKNIILQLKQRKGEDKIIAELIKKKQVQEMNFDQYKQFLQNLWFQRKQEDSIQYVWWKNKLMPLYILFAFYSFKKKTKQFYRYIKELEDFEQTFFSYLNTSHQNNNSNIMKQIKIQKNNDKQWNIDQKGIQNEDQISEQNLSAKDLYKNLYTIEEVNDIDFESTIIKQQTRSFMTFNSNNNNFYNNNNQESDMMQQNQRSCKKKTLIQNIGFEQDSDEFQEENEFKEEDEEEYEKQERDSSSIKQQKNDQNSNLSNKNNNTKINSQKNSIDQQQQIRNESTCEDCNFDGVEFDCIDQYYSEESSITIPNGIQFKLINETKKKMSAEFNQLNIQNQKQSFQV
ncbi:hypothetical protein PPERSA_00630 [Pseudocohnilembus persalinus]|uniref:Uncharacterized protein n=1 Tax=Pseudocohnilembus persalinus TaxID=266149 RepID=A0A0V0QSY6_PSEPJ|nr:hypothetical protein PPERSA_00630 [Pseudocohnilembus persalinus]|eukprot:KRX05329.1 hypothetical protein PPERSA_00630 [Pseudocohnilembus persalinus]